MSFRRQLADGESITVRDGGAKFQVYLDGVQHPNTFGVHRNGDQVGIDFYPENDDGAFYVDASGKEAETEGRLLSVNRVMVQQVR